MAFIKNKFIHIHIPRTGGTTVSKMLNYLKKPNLEYYYNSTKSDFKAHYTCATLKKLIPIEFDKTFKFSFIRNPYDRMVSVYEVMGRRLFNVDENDGYENISDDKEKFLFFFR